MSEINTSLDKHSRTENVRGVIGELEKRLIANIWNQVQKKQKFEIQERMLETYGIMSEYLPCMSLEHRREERLSVHISFQWR